MPGAHARSSDRPLVPTPAVVGIRGSILLLLLAAAASGCGHRGAAAAPASGITPIRADPAGAADTARAYVRALDKRDRSGFCKLLAPWVKARVGRLVKFDKGSAVDATPDAALCVKAAGFIGYYGENAEQRWAGVDLLRVSRAHLEGELAVVDIRVRNHYESTPYDIHHTPHPDRVQRDRVYLVSWKGRWVVAKLSAVAHSASIGFVDTTDPLAPPDVAAERKQYENELDTSHAAQQRDRDTADHDYTECSSIGPEKSIDDPAGDVSWHTDFPSIDLRRVSVATSDEKICFDFETDAPIKAPVAMIVDVRGPPRGLGGFAFDSVLTGPGRAVVGLRYPGASEDAMPAEVGISGNRMSTVVRRDAFPSRFQPLLARFGWSAQSVYHGPLADRRRLSQFDDSVPNSPAPPGSYP